MPQHVDLPWCEYEPVVLVAQEATIWLCGPLGLDSCRYVIACIVLNVLKEEYSSCLASVFYSGTTHPAKIPLVKHLELACSVSQLGRPLARSSDKALTCFDGPIEIKTKSVNMT